MISQAIEVLEKSVPYGLQVKLVTNKELRLLNKAVKELLATEGCAARLEGNLRMLMAVRDLKMCTLAEKVDVHASYISRILDGDASLSFMMLYSVASALETNVTVLLTTDLVQEFRQVIKRLNDQKL